MLLSSVIRAHLDDLFAGRRVESFSQFRVTRDSDLEVDDDVTNLRQALRSGLTTRHFGQAIRIEVVNSCKTELSDFLLRQFALPEAALYRVNGPVNLVRLNSLIELGRRRPWGRPDVALCPVRAGVAAAAAAGRGAHPGTACRTRTCCCTIRLRASIR